MGMGDSAPAGPRGREAGAEICCGPMGIRFEKNNRFLLANFVIIAPRFDLPLAEGMRPIRRKRPRPQSVGIGTRFSAPTAFPMRQARR
eukprot:scaffold1634_cov353-Prasinococcus_capsulatus_cf.AAC.12